MNGDKFREMAARCGELPDSVMAAPGIEYVGEKSTEWEALCARAAAWCDLGPERLRGSTPTEWAQAMEYYRRRALIPPALIDLAKEQGRTDKNCFAGLALFARLMAIVVMEQ